MQNVYYLVQNKYKEVDINGASPSYTLTNTKYELDKHGRCNEGDRI